ncbi:MAG: DUF4097 family beta strand repeat-containing protein [Longimicrobiales bacterium]
MLQRTWMLVVVAAVLLPCAAAAQQPAALRKVEVRRAVRPDALVRIWNLSGEVRVVGWDRDSLVVTGAVPAGHQFHCGGGDAGIKCGVDAGLSTDGAVAGSRLDVRVPARAQLWIKTAGAGVEVGGARGGLDVYSVTGAIRVDGALDVVSVESMGGDITISGSARVLRAKSASGSLTIRAASEDATITSVSGRIRLLGGGLQRARIESVDGPIHWDGGVRAGASLDFVSHSGRVELLLPPTAAADVEVQTYQGTFSNEFGPARLGARPDLDGHEAGFTVGGSSGSRIGVRTFKGAIALRRR